ncbi:MAG: delta 1-pyrroline-5-carboxylate synthetase [Gammaproteobacteria bacterium]|nr:delta 1-pyrroline-5-carboxylate synthetase [Gammaproteobacteria bacterium]
MIIVKLGGSLYQSSHLKPWLKALANLAQHSSIIIVPGGGPFADNVRKAQDNYHFDDSTAHHMALLAMAQFGLLLTGISSDCQRFRYNESPIAANSVSVWLPDETLLAESELVHSWDITSDSLALWLANKLNAEQLILVKSCDIPNDVSIPFLTKNGIIDAGFEQLYRSSPVTLQLINAANHHLLQQSRHTSGTTKIDLS